MVHVPVPVFVSPPLPVFNEPEKEPPVAPPKVSVKPVPVICPVLLIAIEPVSPTILLLLPNVTVPEYVAVVAELFVMAPKLVMPVPLMVVLFAAVSVIPFKSNAPPLETVTDPFVLPRAVVLPSCRVPCDIKVLPLYKFAPDNFHVPVPVLVIPCEFVVNAPAMFPFPVPPRVKTFESLVKAPVFVKLISPALVIILAAVAIVINPI